MPHLTIFTGNIGTGKSLMARKYTQLYNAIIINIDAIQQSLSAGEYGAYDPDKKIVYWTIENTAIEQSLKKGHHVVVDRTNMEASRRATFIDIAKARRIPVTCIDFGPGNERSLNRRLLNPKGVPEKTWKRVHNYMQSSYEEPSMSEGFCRIITPPKKFKFHAFDFDGTIVENKFPDIGEIIDGTVDRLNKLYQDLSKIIIIWTCRSGNYENEMREFLLKQKIPFDFINENQMIDNGGRKIFAHKYYDLDRMWIRNKI